MKHIEELYYQHKGNSMGLTILPKSKLEHIKLTPFSQMRVDLAAEVNFFLKTFQH